MISVPIENPAFANQNLEMSIQVPGRVSSKALATGLHWTTVAIIDDRQYIMTQASSPEQVHLNHGSTENIRR